jgi:colanic acid/amylovoran biosynthesis glycosyltransferase
MTITLVLPQPPAYSETFFRSKIKGLQESGHQVFLVTAATSLKFDGCTHLQHPKVYKNQLVQVLKMISVSITLIPYASKVMSYVKLEQREGASFKRIIEKVYINATLLKLNTDWLHFGFATMAIDRELVGKAIGARTAVSLRGYDIDVFPLKYQNTFDKLWSNIDKVHSISNYLLGKAHALGLPYKVDSKIIHPAVDLNKLDDFKDNINSLNQKLQIVTIARLHWIKGIDDLIVAAHHLKENKIDFGWQIIGDSSSNSLIERFKFQVFQLGLTENVFFQGKKSHEASLGILGQASIYVQTSLSEGFCNAVLEAQSMGKLCVVTDGGALPENVLDQQTGWVVARLQPMLLGLKILEVIHLSQSEKNRISQQAMQRVKNEFTLEQQQESFNRFYTHDF